jgi:hypothetical protein
MEMKRKQVMLKKKKREKTSTKDDMDSRGNIKRENRKWDEINDKWRPHHKKHNCASTTKHREDVPRGAQPKTKNNNAVRHVSRRANKSRKTSQTARGIRTPNTNTV